ncbi:MAG: DUF108 domain-containing protein [Clostridia bacterium]|nr:DUF108 domain-containing protein [Clostridia bacterium]
MKKLAVIGCGALGRILCTNVKKLLDDKYEIIGLFDMNKEAGVALANDVGSVFVDKIEDLYAMKPDYTVEIAGIPAAKAYGEEILKNVSDFIIVSVGSLADEDFKNKLYNAAEESGHRLYIPNGAVGGFDLMQIFSLMGAKSVSIESTKAPRSLNGAPYLEGRELSETEEELVFRGNVKDAIKGFPKNVNVAVATALASDFENTEVRIRSVPNKRENSHAITLEGENMKAEIKITSTPDPVNPKSSVSAAWSIVALLKNLASPMFFY